MAHWKTVAAKRGSGIELPSSLDLMPWETKGNCYKLTDTTTKGLGRLTKQERIFLIQSHSGENFTDGKNIYVDLDDREAWLSTGHELSHIAFGSDPAVARHYANTEAKELVDKYKSQGVRTLEGQEKRVADILFTIINGLEDWRVAYWWGQPFPGDNDLLMMRWTAFAERRAEHAKTDILQYFLCTMMGVAPDDADPDFQVLKPVFEQAFDDVIGVDFHTCLNVASGLLEGVVRILARQPPSPQQQPQQGDQDGGSADSSQSDGTEAGQGDPGDDTGDGEGSSQSDEQDSKDGDQSPGDSQDSDDDEESGEGEGNADGDSDSDDDEESQDDGKEAAKSRRQKRKERAEAEAFQLLVMTGRYDPKLLQEDGWSDQRLSAWMKDKFEKGKPPRSVWSEVDKARGMNLADQEDQDMRSQLMQQVADALRGAGEEQETDDWLLADAKAKVEFVDLGPADIALRFEDLEPESKRLAGRSRTKFQQILGQRRIVPRNAGPKLSVKSFIQRRFTGTGKVFRKGIKIPGFHYIILVDGSGSMIGRRFRAVSEAELMLNYALDFPQVEGEVWTYRLEGDRVVLVRIDPKLGGMPSEVDRRVVGGLTPSHTAIRVATRALRLKQGVRSLFHLTDGMPNTHAKASAFVRQNILEARRFKIGVTTLFIEDGGWGGVPRKSKNYMAGGPEHWTSCRTSGVADATFGMVENRFRDYLKNGI